MNNCDREGKKGCDCFEKDDCRCNDNKKDDCKENEKKEDKFCKLVSENKKLAGIKFELRAKCGCLIACGKTNECGEIKFDNLPFGCYVLTEVEGQKGWISDNKSVLVEICEDKPHKCIEVFNKRNIGSIKVVKFGKEEKFVCEKEKEKEECGCDRDRD